jgi:hypothetical protein
LLVIDFMSIHCQCFLVTFTYTHQKQVAESWWCMTADEATTGYCTTLLASSSTVQWWFGHVVRSFYLVRSPLHQGYSDQVPVWLYCFLDTKNRS